MANIFLLDMIQALAPEERQEALLFLNSPFCNREANAQEVASLYKAILKTAPGFSETDLDKETMYQEVFPGKDLVPGKLDKVMTKLKKLLQTYILTKGYYAPENEVQRQIDWVSWLRKQDLGDRYLLALAKLKDHKEPESYFDHLRLMRIAEEEHEWENAHNRFLGDLKIPKLIHHLDLYYLIYRFELNNRFLLQQKTAQIPGIDIVNNPTEFYIKNNLTLKIAHNINLLFQKETPSVEEFNTLKELLSVHKTDLPFQMLARFQSYLRNCCILLIDRGNSEFVPILHEIHREDLENEYIFMNGKLSANSYLNIVQIAIRAHEIKWAKSVTVEYKGRIHGEDKDQFFYRLNMSNCLFAERKFEEALDMLPEESPTSYYHLMTRRLELKAYYELDSDLLIYKMDSFRKYIERTAPKSIAENLRTMNLNFIYILNQLSQSPPKDKSRSEKILKRIEEKKLICERSWLLEKAQGLK